MNIGLIVALLRFWLNDELVFENVVMLETLQNIYISHMVQRKEWLHIKMTLSYYYINFMGNNSILKRITEYTNRELEYDGLGNVVWYCCI